MGFYKRLQLVDLSKIRVNMLLTFLFFWGLSTFSHGAPHQPPVDHSRIHDLISSSSPQKNNNSVNPLQHPRLQVNRGPGQSQIDNFPSDPARGPQQHSNSLAHGTSGGHYSYDPYNLNHDHHHDHDGHKVPKINKLNIQDIITQRDIEKHKRKDSPWKTYFAEILAAVILVSSITVFLCWWNWSKRVRQRGRGGHSGGMGTSREKRRIHRQNTFQRGQSMPELYVNMNPIASRTTCPKSGVCSPEEPPKRERGSLGATQFLQFNPAPTNV